MNLIRYKDDTENKQGGILFRLVHPIFIYRSNVIIWTTFLGQLWVPNRILTEETTESWRSRFERRVNLSSALRRIRTAQSQGTADMVLLKHAKIISKDIWRAIETEGG